MLEGSCPGSDNLFLNIEFKQTTLTQKEDQCRFSQCMQFLYCTKTSPNRGRVRTSSSPKGLHQWLSKVKIKRIFRLFNILSTLLRGIWYLITYLLGIYILAITNNYVLIWLFPFKTTKKLLRWFFITPDKYNHPGIEICLRIVVLTWQFLWLKLRSKLPEKTECSEPKIPGWIPVKKLGFT